MPRITRFDVPGLPRQVTQRSNNLALLPAKTWWNNAHPRINEPGARGVSAQGSPRMAVDYAIDVYTPMAYILL